MKIISVIPVQGREPLLKYTVGRLVNQVSKVICIGHNESECKAVEGAGADFYYMDRFATVGLKWQKAVNIARDYNPDAILIMGSGGMISDNWCESLYPDLETHAMTGTAGIYFFHLTTEGVKKLIYWSGYPGGRKGEPVGVGRMISRAFLDKCGWNVFDTSLNSSLDFSTMRMIKRLHGTVNINTSDVCSVRVSYDGWSNKNGFYKIARMSPSTMMPVGDIYKWFPELETIKL